MIFLFQGCILRFHVNFPGCNILILNKIIHIGQKTSCTGLSNFLFNMHNPQKNEGRCNLSKNYRALKCRNMFRASISQFYISASQVFFLVHSLENAGWETHFGAMPGLFSGAKLVLGSIQCSGQLTLVGVQPPTNCSFARHLVWKIDIHCSFAHH